MDSEWVSKCAKVIFAVDQSRMETEELGFHLGGRPFFKLFYNIIIIQLQSRLTNFLLPGTLSIFKIRKLCVLLLINLFNKHININYYSMS